MSLRQQLEHDFEARKNWALRRQLGVPNNRRLWICACMDERLPLDDALGIRGDRGDAHVFRNAGGLITADAIRSAMLSCRFFGTTEIVIVNHTECGMMAARAQTLVAALEAQGLNLDDLQLEPGLPELKLEKGSLAKWLKTFENVDEVCALQVEYVRNHPLIPKEVSVSGWIWEVESARLRPPFGRIVDKVNSSREMGAL